MFFNMLAVFAEFEADLLKMRTREGMVIARVSACGPDAEPPPVPQPPAQLQEFPLGDGACPIVPLGRVVHAGLVEAAALHYDPDEQTYTRRGQS